MVHKIRNISFLCTSGIPGNQRINGYADAMAVSTYDCTILMRKADCSKNDQPLKDA